MQSHISPTIRTLTLTLLGAFLTYLFWLISDLSFSFEQGSEGITRPIIPVMLLFAVAFVVYGIAWWIVGGFGSTRFQSSPRATVVELIVILGFAVAFRAITVSSVPIQEIDIYRYIWDGAVTAEKLDPFRYGPQTVLKAVQDPKLETQRPGLKPYCEIVEKRPGLYKVLDIVHFGQYTSPYPPTSQFFFGLTVAAMPLDTSAAGYLVAMKVMLISFDFATGLVIVLLLWHLGLSHSWALAYLWCPLVIKEVANGGHLDSIANLFTLVAVFLLVRAVWPDKSEDEKQDPDAIRKIRFSTYLTSWVSALTLAFAVAAKVYPVVLLPLGAVVLFKRTLLINTVSTITVFLVAVVIFSLPILRHIESAQSLLRIDKTQVAELNDADPSGLEAFSKFWEMNDFLFMVVVENLKPDPEPNANGVVNKGSTPWFRVTPNEFRESVVAKVKPLVVTDIEQKKYNYRPSHFAFFATRFLTVCVFGLIILWSCFDAYRRDDDPRVWLGHCFIALAWFWLLSPTQNPWYWTWAMPFLVLVRGRTWFFVSGMALIYYIRFWFRYHMDGQNPIGFLNNEFGDPAIFDILFPFAESFDYKGTLFFDYYLPVIQFAPILIGLLIGVVWRWKLHKGNETDNIQTVKGD